MPLEVEDAVACIVDVEYEAVAEVAARHAATRGLGREVERAADRRTRDALSRSLLGGRSPGMSALTGWTGGDETARRVVESATRGLP